jgi:Eukaryotic protein of unknown function (DUF829)
MYDLFTDTGTGALYSQSHHAEVNNDTVNIIKKVSTTMLVRDQMVRTMIRPSPDAIAIIMGPLGSYPDMLVERYGRTYYDRNCSVILSASPPIRFMLNMSLQSTARDVLHHTAMAIQDTPSHVPVIMHSFSNGGTFLLEEIEVQLNERQWTESHPSLVDEKYAAIRSRLKIGYQFFDSCPCYVRTIWDTKHFNSSFPNRKLSTFGRYVYTIGASFSLTMWCVFTLSWSRPQQFWNRLLHSTVCSNQIFMYTTADLLTDAAAVDRFINIRRSQGVQCTIHRYDDSDHCRLDIDHPVEYRQVIDDALTTVLQRNTNRPSLG